MQLTPRYGGEPVITLDGCPSAIAEPTIRQRNRLIGILQTLSDEQWMHPSRCAGWTNRDVILHLDSTNSFWAFAIAAGVRGQPTQFLATFDPVTSPAQLVAGATDASTDETLAEFVASTTAFNDLLASLDDDGWSALAEAPPGHISVSALTHHALWDSWVHERDIVLPLGMAAVEQADEIEACLRYGAALGPAFAINRGAPETGRLAVAVNDPSVEIVVDIGDRVVVRSGVSHDGDADLVLTGSAVEVLEALSIRRTLSQPIAASAAWMLRGLSDTFDDHTDRAPLLG